MRTHAAARIKDLIQAGSYGELRVWLGRAEREELARCWEKLAPLHKLIAFKLMDAVSALEFFRRLPYKERYFLFSGFPQASIAPVLEDAPPSVRRLFVQLPSKFYGLMLRELSPQTSEALR